MGVVSVTGVAIATGELALPRRLVLASASPRRRHAFALLGLPFDVSAAEVDESPYIGEAPADLVRRLSLVKARVVAARSDGPTLVVGADTVVAFEGEALGKPGSVDEARHMLFRLRGQTHEVHSAIAMVDTVRGREGAWLSTTCVRMRDYTPDEIEAYIASGDPMDKAGAYAIQHPVFRPAAQVIGCYATVMGVPLRLLVGGLQSAGVALGVDARAICPQFTGQPCLASCAESVS